jgi:hypothetical protein
MLQNRYNQGILQTKELIAIGSVGVKDTTFEVTAEDLTPRPRTCFLRPEATAKDCNVETKSELVLTANQVYLSHT